MVNNFMKVLITLICLVISSNSYALSTDSTHAILIDYSSGEKIFEKNADSKMYPSSMTKLMTVYVALKSAKNGELDLNKKFKISKKAWQMTGSKMFLNQGEMVTALELVKGVIVLSGNDAAVALSEAVAGSEESFAKMMNQEAEIMGLNNSNFINSSGLTAKNHHMSATDIATLSIKLFEDFPEYYNIFSMDELSYANITQPNRNSLLGEQGIDGLKTGSTDAGGYGLAFMAERDGRRIVGVVNGLKNQSHRHKAAKQLLDHAYDDFTFYKIASKKQIIVDIPVHYGETTKVGAIAHKNVGITELKDSNKNISVKVLFKGPIPAPISEGEQIATLLINANGVEKKIPLYAEKNIAKASIFTKFQQNLIYKIRALVK